LQSRRPLCVTSSWTSRNPIVLFFCTLGIGNVVWEEGKRIIKVKVS
jgi:hypothetical protein